MSDSNTEERALVYRNDINHIYVMAYGTRFYRQHTNQLPDGVQLALEKGTTEGRRGLGSIFVQAAGNSGHATGCAYDERCNSIYTITVGSIDRHNKYQAYSEACPAVMVVTYSEPVDAKENVRNFATT